MDEKKILKASHDKNAKSAASVIISHSRMDKHVRMPPDVTDPAENKAVNLQLIICKNRKKPLQEKMHCCGFPLDCLLLLYYYFLPVLPPDVLRLNLRLQLHVVRSNLAAGQVCEYRLLFQAVSLHLRRLYSSVYSSSLQWLTVR